ncbi:uncharacterized protein LOC110461134 [Mizuhopecten yessoensis]|uniref:G-protein coupled receptor Mth2 n=1 Tax=Mizuhopecten yessoensis TaxID=6573 RepID=A0A210Q0Z7_MIZYE|nr:uncharacterized protein LOC110461134 [Mizuhopecten yessoensis]OWF42402.1 G-protein coupled receptor Mth2 [Mizuhopecten yessoensis]
MESLKNNILSLLPLLAVVTVTLPCFRCQYTVDNFKLEWNLGSQKCQSSWTCADNVSSVIDLCQCDDRCRIYDDCCLGADHGSDVQHNVHLTCKYIPEVKEKAYVHIIETCPNSYNNDQWETLCENVTSGDDITIRTPVSGVKSGFLYRNMYCAMCHREDYVTWRPGIDCTWKIDYYGRNYSLVALLNDSNCRTIFEPPPSLVNLELRECLPVVDSCEEKFNDGEKCQTGDRALVFGKAIFKNIHCALCNSEVLANLSCDPNSVQIFPKNPNKRKPINYSYRLLVDLQALTSVGVASARRAAERKEERDLSNFCTDSWVYDPLAETCRQIFCAVPFVYKDKKCALGSVADTNLWKTENDEQHLPCPYVRLNQSEYQIINTDQVFILSSGFIYSKNDSYIGDGFALVCVQEPLNKTRFLEPDKVTLVFSSVESVLSVVCECLSITALCLGLMIYVCFPKLQNIPGKNLICLMASLLTAQVLFILAPLAIGVTPLCTIVAIVMHYAYLAAFFWMNVMAVDIFLTFSRGLAQSRSDKGTDFQHFFSYSLYSWLTPAVIVSIAVVFDFTTLELDSKPKYGAVVCWISNSYALLYFFLVPLFALVFTNMILFIFTARAIYVSDKSTSRILQKKQTCKLLIYMKLSSVMGFTWGFACVATFANLPPFWYLFVIFNALQGVLIFLSFVCSKKVLGLLKAARSGSCVQVCYTRYGVSTQRSSDTSTSSRSNRTLLSVISYKSSKCEESESTC